MTAVVKTDLGTVVHARAKELGMPGFLATLCAAKVPQVWDLSGYLSLLLHLKLTTAIYVHFTESRS